MSGTGRGFGSAPLKKHKRCVPFGGQLRTSKNDSVKARRKLTIVIFSLCTLGLIAFFSDFKYKKTLKYRGHEIQYDQYLKGKKYLYVGHYLYNADLVDQAYMILANRLLDDYLKSPDSLLKVDILQISNEHNLRRGLEIKSIDSLLTNREFVLDTLILID